MQISLAKKQKDEEIEKEVSHQFQDYWRRKNDELVFHERNLFGFYDIF